jgi:hypothetical protein
MWHQTPGEPRPAAMVACILSRSQAEPLNLPLKGGHLLSEVGQQLGEVDSPCPPPYLTNNKLYFLFLKTLLLLFVSWH